MAISPKGFNLQMFKALKNRQFLWMWGANLFSNFGTSTYVLAINWIAVKEHGGIGLGAITLAYGGTQFLLQLVGGVVSDRFNRKAIFSITESLAFVVAIILAIAGERHFYPIWFLALMNGLNGGISAFDTPARTTLINDLVATEEVAEAQELYGLAASITSVLGPVLGGFLLSLGHTGIAFGFNAISFIPVLISLLFIHPRPKELQPKTVSVLNSITEGIYYARRNETVKILLLLMAIVMILGMPYQTLLPMFAHTVLHAGSTEFAALSSAVGLGGFIGALFVTNISNTPRPGQWLLYGSITFGFCIFLFVQSPIIHWASLSVFLAGTCNAIVLNLDSGLLQSLTPVEFRGRVASLSGLNKGGLSISAAIAGYSAHYVGMVAVQMMLIILLWSALIWISPTLIKLRQTVETQNA